MLHLQFSNFYKAVSDLLLATKSFPCFNALTLRATNTIIYGLQIALIGQKQLGEVLGFLGKTSDVRIAQYESDFIKKADVPMYYVSVDPSGKLGWKSSVLHYVDTTAHIIEILTEKSSNSYKAFLRKIGISYIIAGQEELDSSLAMEKLYTLFDIHTLMLGGGGSVWLRYKTK